MNIADLFCYYSVLISTFFRFLVELDRKMFTIHSTLIAHHSKPLNVLINENMLKAKKKCVSLKDVDENTFVRFSQYAYTEDYIAANSNILSDFFTIISTHLVSNEVFNAQSKSESELELVRNLFDFDISNDDWRFFKKNKKKAKIWSKKFELWGNFKSKAYIISKPAFQSWKNRELCEDYTEIFLYHARLYVFADKYDVDSLKDLSLHMLQRTLIEFTLYDERIENIINLLRYSYSNTTDRSESIDDLRLLVVHYFTCVVENLSRSNEFQLLLKKVDSFARDLVKQMLERLS